MTPAQIALIVLGGLAGILLLVFLLLLLVRVKIHIVVGQEAHLTLQVLFLRFTLWKNGSRKKKRKRLIRCKNPDEVLAKERLETKRMIRKRLKKRHKKQLKKEQKKLKKQQRKAKLPKLNLQEKIEMVYVLLRLLYEKTHGKTRIHIRSFYVSVGTDDAAKTAIAYGVVAQSAACLLEMIDSQFARIRYDGGAVVVVPDFITGQSAIYLDLTCSVTPFTALLIYNELTDDYRFAQQEIYLKAAKRIREERRQKELEKQQKELLKNLDPPQASN